MADRILALAPHACVMCGDEIVFAGAVTVAAKEAAARACATEVTCLAFPLPNFDGAALQGRAVSFGLGKVTAVPVIADTEYAEQLSCRQGNKGR